MKIKMLLAVSLVVALLVFAVSGCCMPSGCGDFIGDKVSSEVEKSVEKAIEDETGTDIETEESTEADGKDLESVPRYPDATRTLYIKGEPIDGNVSISINYETTDAPSKVVSWYKDKMSGLGWTVKITIAGTDGGEMITYSKNGDETTATVNVTKSGDKTEIGIIYNGVESGA